jgi:hypothetical protein
MTMLNDFGLEAVRRADAWLDAEVSPAYKEQELAQHWARVCKSLEEGGEAVAELIASTGQNPRKPADPRARHKMLCELADGASARILAIQHFTKDEAETDAYLANAIGKVWQRAADAGY